MKKITIYLTIFLLLVPYVIFAQQEPMYGQYYFNNAVINPAQAGSEGIHHFGVLVRNQWVGIDGAPRTVSAYANLRFPGQLGLAIGIYQDKLGAEENLHFQTDLAYHARISENWNLAGGIRITGSHMRANLSEVPNVDPRNPNFMTDYTSGVKISTGAGFLAYSNKTYFGLSIPQAFRYQVSFPTSGNIDFRKKEILYAFAYGGTNIQLSDKLLLTPSTLLKYSDAPLQIDLNALFGYGDIISFGPFIRSNIVEKNKVLDAMGFLIGVHFFDNWHLGYFYEYPLSDLRNATMQTHEISLRFFWNKKQEAVIRSPRYFM